MKSESRISKGVEEKRGVRNKRKNLDRMNRIFQDEEEKKGDKSFLPVLINPVNPV